MQKITILRKEVRKILKGTHLAYRRLRERVKTKGYNDYESSRCSLYIRVA